MPSQGSLPAYSAGGAGPSDVTVQPDASAPVSQYQPMLQALSVAPKLNAPFGVDFWNETIPRRQRKYPKWAPQSGHACLSCKND